MRNKNPIRSSMIRAAMRNPPLPGPPPGVPVTVDAPPYPYGPAVRKVLESTWATVAIAENCNQATMQCSLPITKLTDEAFDGMYLQVVKIPYGFNATWQPYVDSWLRLRDLIISRTANYAFPVKPPHPYESAVAQVGSIPQGIARVARAIR